MLITQIMKQESALALLTSLAQADNISTVSIDTETNGKEIRDGRGQCLGVSIAWRDTEGIISFFMPFDYSFGMSPNYEIDRFREPLQYILDNKKTIYHNAKFDLVSLETLGLDSSRNRFIDTMILGHLVDENRPRAKSLEAMSLHYLKKPGKLMQDDFKKALKTFGWDMPNHIMAPYAATDTASTLELAEKLMPLAKAESLGDMWLHKEKFIRLVMNMELNGVGINTRLANREIQRGEDRMNAIVDELGGLSPSKREHLEILLIHQLGLPYQYNIDKKTRQKKITFDKHAMEKYDHILSRINDPTAQRILEFRGWQKSVSSNYKPYIELLSPDGRLRCNYKLHGTKTGRMSCEKPNLQQIPRQSAKDWNGNLKRVFQESNEYGLYEVDYSQLEFRLGTAHAGETKLQEVFASDRDVFTEMSQEIGMTRQESKSLTYTIQYGGGVGRVSEVFGVSPATAKQIINNYYSKYPKFRMASAHAGELVKRHGKLRLWSGRYRHFVDPRNEYYKAFNSLIQGGSADIVERVMLQLDRNGFNSTDDCRMLLQVHDSVIFKIRRDSVDSILPEIKNTMQDVTSATGVDFGVRFAVDAKEWGH